MSIESDLLALYQDTKRLLRKYAVTHSQGNNVQCNCCHYFGLYAHKEGCELAPYLTKEIERTSSDKRAKA